MNDFVAKDIRFAPESSEDDPKRLMQAAIKHVAMQAPNDERAQADIMVAVQNLYWSTSIKVGEIRDAYLPGGPINAVWEVARIAQHEMPNGRRSSGTKPAKQQNVEDGFDLRETWIESQTFQGNPESVTREALKYVRILAPNDQDAQKAILVTIQALYWTTDIPVSEIGEAYAPGLPISAVVAIAGPTTLNIVCRTCSAPLYVTSRSAFDQMHKRFSYCRRDPSGWDICPVCRERVTAELVRQSERQDIRDQERRNDGSSTVAMPYRDYLQSDDWKYRRDRALRRAGFRCQVCSGNGELHVHHRTYVRRGNEAKGDLIVLCATCHQLFHENGKLADGGRADV
jgi:5-methylcytosine-specific restriction endonuclease McrA